MNARKIALGSALAVAWAFQYALAVPALYIWRATIALVRGALKIGFVGLVLLCLPVIGWIILGAMLLVRRSERAADRRHAETLAALGVAPAAPAPKRSPLRPWGLEALRSA